MPLNRIVAFLLTRRPEAAILFYRDTLGFTFLRDDGFALVFDAGGTMLRISKVPDFTPAQHTVLGWEVENISEAVTAIADQGVVFERYDFMKPDEQGICTFPTGDKVAWFKDPDGNVLSLSRHVASAV